MKLFYLSGFFYLLCHCGYAQSGTPDFHVDSNRNYQPFEIGIHAGLFKISDDVDQGLLPGYGAGIHFRRAVNSALSLRGELFYGKSYGLDALPATDNLIDDNGIFEGYGIDNPWFFSFQSQLIRANIQGLIELTNLGHEARVKDWNLYVYAGFGLNSHGTKLNLRDESNQPYTDLVTASGYNKLNDPNTNKGRRAIRNQLKEIYDDTYETDAPKEFGKFRLGDETNIFPELSFGFGISKKISPAFDISLDHQFIVSNNNYLDGKAWRSGVDQTNGVDLVQYTSIRLAHHLHFRKSDEALYWVNPWNEIQNQLDSIPMYDPNIANQIGDDDQDGIINNNDIEPATGKNQQVDGLGKTISNKATQSIDEIQARLSQLEKQINNLVSGGKEYNMLKQEIDDLHSRVNILFNSLMPTLYFDINSDELDLDAYKDLAEISSLLKVSNSTCVILTGFADEHNTKPFNQNLSLKRANKVKHILQTEFDHVNLIINVLAAGEDDPIITTASNSYHHALNRRVKVTICQ